MPIIIIQCVALALLAVLLFTVWRSLNEPASPVAVGPAVPRPIPKPLFAPPAPVQAPRPSRRLQVRVHTRPRRPASILVATVPEKLVLAEPVVVHNEAKVVPILATAGENLVLLRPDGRDDAMLRLERRIEDLQAELAVLRRSTLPARPRRDARLEAAAHGPEGDRHAIRVYRMRRAEERDRPS